jgi:acylphosphatase
MKAVRLIVRGRVQKVGYRSIVERIAFESGVTGYVKNRKDKTVEIVAQHENEQVLKKFTDALKIKEYPVTVVEIISEEIVPKTYDDFEVVEGPLNIENRESLELGVIYMRELAKDMKGTREELGSKMDATLEVSKQTLAVSKDGFNRLEKKLDTTNEKLDLFSASTIQQFNHLDTKYGKVSVMLERISVALEALAGIKPKSDKP